MRYIIRDRHNGKYCASGPLGNKDGRYWTDDSDKAILATWETIKEWARVWPYLLEQEWIEVPGRSDLVRLLGVEL